MFLSVRGYICVCICGVFMRIHRSVYVRCTGYGLAPALNSPLPEEASGGSGEVGGGGGEEGSSSSSRRSMREKKQTMGETINLWSRAAFNFLLSLGVPPAGIICFGRSIGTGRRSLFHYPRTSLHYTRVRMLESSVVTVCGCGGVCTATCMHACTSVWVCDLALVGFCPLLSRQGSMRVDSPG